MVVLALATYPNEAMAGDASQAGDDEVVVRGRRRSTPVSSREPTVASTRIDRERLETPGGSAAEVLRTVPGVRVARRGSSSDLSTAAIRGATSAQTPVYLAGVRLNDDVTGTADLSTVPLWMVDRIEVFRGHAPAGADRLGVGGAVLLEPRWPRRPSVGAGGEVGSFGADAEWVAGSVGDGESGALVSLRHAQADNDFTYVDDTSGTPREVVRDNADARTLDAWLLGRAAPARGARLSLVGNAFDREQGAPGLGVVPARQARMRTRRGLAALTTRLPCGRDERGEVCTLELGESVLASDRVVDDPLRELSPAVETESRGVRIGESATVSLAVADRLDLDVGAATAIERLSVDRDAAPVTRARRLGARAFAAARFEAYDDVVLGALGALECQATDAAGFRGGGCDALQPVGRLGASVPVGGGLSVRGNVGRYVRFPTLAELFGFSAVVRGSPELSVETGATADAGVRFAPRSTASSPWELFGDAFVFARWSDDLVAFRRSALGVVRPYNVGSARALGAELSARVGFARLVENELSVTLLDPRDTTGAPGNDLLPFQSRLVAADRVELGWRADTGALERVALATQVVHRSSQFADQAGLVVIAAQTTVDVEVSTTWLDGRVALRGAVQNVADARQLDTVGLPLPGRAVHVGAEVWWW